MRLTALAALALVLLVARPALAMSVAVSFSGSVSEVFAYDYATGGLPALATEIGGSVAVGTRFSGRFGFDDAAPPYSANATEATYRMRDPAWTFQTLLGDYASVTDATSGFDLGVYDGGYFGYGISVFGVSRALSGPGASSLDYLLADLALRSNSPDLLTSTALDAVPWELAAYSQGGRMVWTFQRGSEYVSVSGELDMLSLAAVPEPALGGLAALAVLGSAGLGFRRARS